MSVFTSPFDDVITELANCIDEITENRVNRQIVLWFV